MHPTRLTPGTFFDRWRDERRTESFSFAERVALLPEREVPSHTHEEAHFVFVVRGQYLTNAHNRPEVCLPSTLIFNPRGTTHRDRFRTDDGVFFTISVASEVAALIEKRVERARYFDDVDVLSPVRRAYVAFRNGDAFADLILEGVGLELAGRIAAERVVDDHTAPRWLLRARDLLRESSSPQKVGDAAREAGVHPVHLARAFRRYFGASPGEYLRRCRVDRARELLESSRLPLAEVALAAGFAAQSDLTHAFRRAFGTTPAAYRRLFQIDKTRGAAEPTLSA